MSYRNGNYAAFYVTEPFGESNLGAHATRDFVYYNLLRTWKGQDRTFPFIDSHNKNYNVRDGSDWERTLKPRIRERLRNSKNIVLFLSTITKNSRALREEVDYGINYLGLPVIVVYPDFTEKDEIRICSSGEIRKKVKNLWNTLPKFRDSMESVPTLHIPNKKALIRAGLESKQFMVQTADRTGKYSFPCEPDKRD